MIYGYLAIKVLKRDDLIMKMFSGIDNLNIKKLFKLNEKKFEKRYKLKIRKVW